MPGARSCASGSMPGARSCASDRPWGKELRQRIDAWGKETGEQIGQLRERMAHLEGLLEGLREAIAGKRVA